MQPAIFLKFYRDDFRSTVDRTKITHKSKIWLCLKIRPYADLGYNQQVCLRKYDKLLLFEHFETPSSVT